MKKAVDYSKLATEQNNSRSRKIDRLPVEKILQIMHQEDQSVPILVAKARKQIAQGVKLITTAIKTGGRIFFAGAGTSGRLGILEAAECPPTFNTAPSLVQAFMAGGKKAVFRSQEGAEDRREEAVRIFEKRLRRGDVVVGIAASGVTPFALGALETARKKSAKTILVTCGGIPSIPLNIDCLIAVKTGPEVITGSTRLKAGTATKLILNRLTVASMIRLGKVYENWMVDLQPRSKKLKARALRLIQNLGKVSSENEAENYLMKANNKTKIAILMARNKIDYAAARRQLKKSGGFLEKALR
jgi:N-acetylmuramic acid 6-phosphate etherase